MGHLLQVVFAGEHPLFQQDIGAVSLFCENVRQVLAEIGGEGPRGHVGKGTKRVDDSLKAMTVPEMID